MSALRRAAGAVLAVAGAVVLVEVAAAAIEAGPLLPVGTLGEALTGASLGDRQLAAAGVVLLLGLAVMAARVAATRRRATQVFPRRRRRIGAGWRVGRRSAERYVGAAVLRSTTATGATVSDAWPHRRRAVAVGPARRRPGGGTAGGRAPGRYRPDQARRPPAARSRSGSGARGADDAPARQATGGQARCLVLVRRRPGRRGCGGARGGLVVGTAPLVPAALARLVQDAPRPAVLAVAGGLAGCPGRRPGPGPAAPPGRSAASPAAWRRSCFPPGGGAVSRWYGHPPSPVGSGRRQARRGGGRQPRAGRRPQRPAGPCRRRS